MRFMYEFKDYTTIPAAAALATTTTTTTTTNNNNNNNSSTIYFNQTVATKLYTLEHIFGF